MLSRRKLFGLLAVAPAALAAAPAAAKVVPSFPRGPLLLTNETGPELFVPSNGSEVSNLIKSMSTELRSFDREMDRSRSIIESRIADAGRG